MMMASLGTAKVQGLIIDRREVGDVGRFDSWTDEQLVKEAAGPHLVEDDSKPGITTRNLDVRLPPSSCPPWPFTTSGLAVVLVVRPVLGLRTLRGAMFEFHNVAVSNEPVQFFVQLVHAAD